MNVLFHFHPLHLGVTLGVIVIASQTLIIILALFLTTSQHLSLALFRRPAHYLSLLSRSSGRGLKSLQKKS